MPEPSERRIVLKRLEEDQALQNFCCGSDSWDEQLNDFIQNDALGQQVARVNTTTVAYQDAVPIGFITASTSSVPLEPTVKARPGLADIPYGQVGVILVGRLAVAEEYQSRGIGSGLLAWLKIVVREGDMPYGSRFLAVEVDRENEKAISFYQKNGFEIFPRKKRKQLCLMLYDLFRPTALRKE